MLHLVLGRAGSGKTSSVMQEMKAAAETKGSKSVLIVPEQFSHDAERQLCKICGDFISLYAEVLSFSRLSNRIFAEIGGLHDKVLDSGGRILMMHRALAEVASGLKIYTMADRKTEFLENLLYAYDEFKSSCIDMRELFSLTDQLPDLFRDKIRDLVLLFEAYEAIKPYGVLDPRDRFSMLAEGIAESSLGRDEHIYVDGFTDFTEQEILVLEAFLKKGSEMTICLTCGGLEGEEDIFELPRRTAGRFVRFARERGIPVTISTKEGDAKNRAPELVFLERELFAYSDAHYTEECSAVALYKAESLTAECEMAAAKILELVRCCGYRYRDISVVAHGWEKYESIAENIFEKYGVPAVFSRKKEILQQPILLFVTAALDIVSNNWNAADVFKFLKTNLTGLSFDERDVLEDYVLKWNIRGEKMWTRHEPWTFNPSGNFMELGEDEKNRLSLINEIRTRVAKPIKKLQDALKGAGTAGEKVRALYCFLCDTNMPERIAEKAGDLEKKGWLQLRDEYMQLWDILVSAMEQLDDVIGGLPLESGEFGSLFKLLLSQYEVGTIPALLDGVGVGEMARMRRRDVKCLIVLGVTDDAIPGISEQPGILTDLEREKLSMLGLGFKETSETRIQREMNILYSSFTLPKDKLVLSYVCNEELSARPAFVVPRIQNLFGIQETETDTSVRTASVLPCFELAAEAANLPDDRNAALAFAYFKQNESWAGRFQRILDMAACTRGRLSEAAAQKLYRDKINVTASRVDRYYSCKFSYFMQYGLRAKPRKAAKYDAPEVGTFMHFVLENVAREAEKRGGFGTLDEKDCESLTKRYVDLYIQEVLNGFQDKSSRFRYLFHRLVRDVREVVKSMAEELKNSSFKPIDFELSFSAVGDLPPVTLSDGEVEIAVSGKVDRIDGWICGDKLYVKIVDYKTGKKAFNLSDIWYGLGMQMLIYLFALQREGKSRYHADIVPAGVLYAPAKDIILPCSSRISDEEIARQKAKSLVRSGLILDNAAVIEAMESGNAPKYLPIKFNKEAKATGDSLVTAERLGALSRHIDEALFEMGREMKRGNITADPYYKNSVDNACIFCDFYEACHFDEANGGDKTRYLTKLKTPEVWDRLEKEEKNR